MDQTSENTGVTVLVTGSEGFTGRYVASALAGRGYRVVGMDFVDRPGAPDYLRVDITDKGQVADAIASLRPRAVVHLASVAFVGNTDTRAMYLINVVGTRHLLEALAASGAGDKGVILAGSANIYGRHEGGGAIAETAPANPMNDYAISKLAMEHTARLWSDCLPIAVTRPFNYTGVGQSELFLIPKIVAHFVRRSEYIELGNLDVSRDFSDVRFVAEAYAGLLAAEPWGRSVNICSGRSHSLQAILAMCEEISGHRVEVRQRRDLMRDNEIKDLRGDASLLESLGAVRGAPSPPLRETLRWMISGGGAG